MKRTDLKIPYYDRREKENFEKLFNYLRDSCRRVKLPDWIGWGRLASAMAG